MTLQEKQKIAATARKLIRLLLECDDEEFVNKVVSCVQDGTPEFLDTRYL